MTSQSTTDRTTDLSQPLERLGPDETLKARSDFLRGTIALDLLDRITGGVTFESNKLMKFHGIYQQDDRDIQDERRRQKLEPAYSFMVRLRLPGGICSPQQWLKVDELARAHGAHQFRLTTRQTFQFHWVLKEQIRPAIQGLHEVLLDTIAACGDVARTIMCSADPADSEIHAEVAALATELSREVIPRAAAYHEIWYGKERVADSGPAEDEEPLYGRTYLPRKFKIGFVIPPSNDVDVFTQDLGFIAVVGPAGLEGFNISIGGGMGRSDQDPTTYARLADVIGFIPKEQVIAAAKAIIGVQRDFGNRADRAHARFKYTIDSKGLDWIKAEIERRLGAPFGTARPFDLISNADVYGWRETDRGLFNFTLFVENGRILDRPDRPLMRALREIARVHTGNFRLTPNQNVMIADVAPEDRATIDAILKRSGISSDNQGSALRLHSVACVALPTCPLAMAEAERYLPELVSKIELLLEQAGLASEPITVRMSGCPNGCSRPYVSEIALTGRAPGKYNLYLGGSFSGSRLNQMTHENIAEGQILEILADKFARFARERASGEHFGDFVARQVQSTDSPA